MKTLKKVCSMLLIVSMLSACVMSVGVSAKTVATQKVLVDFEGNYTDYAGVKAAETTYGTLTDTSWKTTQKDQPVLVDTGDNEHGKAVKIWNQRPTSNGTAVSGDSQDSNAWFDYRLSAEPYTVLKGDARISMSIYDPGKVGTKYNNIVIDFMPNINWTISQYTTVLELSGDKIKVDGVEGNRSATPKWYDVTFETHHSEKTIDVEVKEGNTVVVSKKGITYKNYSAFCGFSTRVFVNGGNSAGVTAGDYTYGSYVYIDDIKIETLAKVEAGPAVFTENFDSYDAYAGSTTNLKGATNDWGKWNTHTLAGRGNDPVLVDLNDGTHENVVEVYHYRNGSNGGEVAKWEQYDGWLEYALDKAATGITRITTSIKPFYDGDAGTAVGITSNNTPISLLYFAKGNINTVYSNALADRKIGTFEKEKWYDIELIIDSVNNKYHAYIMCEGSTVAETEDIIPRLENDINTNADITSGIGSIYFRQYRNADDQTPQEKALYGKAYVDNFSIENGYVIPEKVYEPTTEDFTDVTTTNMNQKDIYNLHNSSPVAFETKDADHGNSAKLVCTNDSGVKSGGVIKYVSKADKSTYKVSTDVYFNGSNTYVGVMDGTRTNNPTVGDGFPTDKNLLYSCFIGADGTARVATEKSGAPMSAENGQELCKGLTAGNWYTVETIVNLDSGYRVITIKNATGTVLGSKKVDNLLSANSTDVISSIGAVAVWHRTTDTTTPIYVDNISCAEYFPVPEITDNSVTVKYYDDTTATDIANVETAVSSIVLDFGTTVEGEGVITFKDSKNNSAIVSTVFDSTNQVCTLTTKFLTPGETYTLSASGYENSKGTEMTAYTKTIKAAAKGKLEVTATSSINKVSELTEGMSLTVTTSYLNSTGANAKLTYIIAYYNNNSLIRTEIVPASSKEPGYNNALTQNFTIGDLDGQAGTDDDVTQINVFLWNDLVSLMPYCPAVIID